LTLRDESIPEPVRPIRVQVCWAPAEKPCEGCGIPVSLCEPSTCELRQAIKKAANIEKAADEEYILITF